MCAMHISDIILFDGWWITTEKEPVALENIISNSSLGKVSFGYDKACGMPSAKTRRGKMDAFLMQSGSPSII